MLTYGLPRTFPDFLQEVMVWLSSPSGLQGAPGAMDPAARSRPKRPKAWAGGPGSAPARLGLGLALVWLGLWGWLFLGFCFDSGLVRVGIGLDFGLISAGFFELLGF